MSSIVNFRHRSTYEDAVGKTSHRVVQMFHCEICSPATDYIHTLPNHMLIISSSFVGICQITIHPFRKLPSKVKVIALVDVPVCIEWWDNNVSIMKVEMQCSLMWISRSLSHWKEMALKLANRCKNTSQLVIDCFNNNSISTLWRHCSMPCICSTKWHGNGQP